MMAPSPLFPVPLEKNWFEVLFDEFQQEYMHRLLAFLQEEWSGSITIYPRREDIFAALNATPFSDVKVVIMGQDPYHGAGQAHGLSFSVLPGMRVPPSLRNIYQELHDDLGLATPTTGYLLPWAQQGVLMLNATLTVRAGKPASHCGRGWERFTDAIIMHLVQRPQPPLFLLWGKNAQEKVLKMEGLEGMVRSCILKAAHPSPYSAHQGFLGCRHFSQVSTLLRQRGLAPIDWRLP